eukprot:scaffold676_cov316-Pavlova_lutheri.AAC.12
MRDFRPPLLLNLRRSGASWDVRRQSTVHPRPCEYSYPPGWIPCSSGLEPALAPVRKGRDRPIRFRSHVKYSIEMISMKWRDLDENGVGS